MSMSGEIQVRQFYVADKYPAHATITALKNGQLLDVAALDPNGTAVANNSDIMFAVKNNKGGVSLSDAIKSSNVMYAHSKSYSGANRKSVTISDIPVVANELYTVSIPISGYGSLSIENEYIKEGFYKAITGDTVENVVDGLIISLARNFSREQPPANTTTTYTKKGGATVVLQDNLVFEFDKVTTDGTAEISTLTVTVVASEDGTVKVTLNGKDHFPEVTALGATVTSNAAEIAAYIDNLADYEASNVAGLITITATNERAEADLAFDANGVAGIAATAATTTPGVDGTVFGIKISEKDWLPEYYVTGKKSRLFLDFKVDARFPGDSLPTVTNDAGSDGSGTGYQVRNLEYYLLGNRQDSLRGAGYPHNFEAKYDSKLDGTYALLEIGYYDESRDDPMKSKKQITIAMESVADMNLLIAEVNKALLAKGIVVADVA